MIDFDRLFAVAPKISERQFDILHAALAGLYIMAGIAIIVVLFVSAEEE